MTAPAQGPASPLVKSRKATQAKALRAARTDTQREADAVKRRDREARANARPPKVPRPPPVEPRRTLVTDDRPGVIERRRADCAHLGACESAWALVYGGEQARCPTTCRGFEPRAEVRLVSIGGRGGVSLG